MRAREFAAKAHASQKYGDKPYVTHLDRVAELAKEFGRPELVEAAYLHDVLEDTLITRAEMAKEFGEATTKLVEAVTNDDPTAPRKERAKATYPKILAAGEKAIFLKLCDRLANVTAAKKEGNDGLLKMYRGEHEAFKDALYGNVPHLGMWKLLEAALS